MISRLQLNLRSDSISPTSQLPATLSLSIDPKSREKRSDTDGTFSSFSYFFESTVTELSKDIDVMDERRRADDTEVAQIQIIEVEAEIELGPIPPVSGGLPVEDMPMFSPQESEWLEDAIQVSPAMVDEKGGGWWE
jgi:hypothetical protein